MRDFWKGNDVFVNLSDVEGMPVSLLEAMSWGVVPIVTRTSGIEATVEDGVNGYVCGRGDVDLIFSKIQFFAQDRQRLNEMAKACRDRVAAEHDRREYVRFLVESI